MSLEKSRNPRDVIIAPVVSEKSYALIETNVYTFVVHPDAGKPEIRNAIERLGGEAPIREFNDDPTYQALQKLQKR